MFLCLNNYYEKNYYKKQYYVTCFIGGFSAYASSLQRYLKIKEYNNVSYFQNLDHTGFHEEKINNYTPFEIQSGDILGINVISPSNQEAASVFNTSTNRVIGANPDAINPVYGFKVDDADGTNAIAPGG